MNYEYLNIAELQPAERNARKHAERDIEAIKKSIQEFGFNDPIGVWGPENTIVEGHGRLQAASELGLEKVPVVHLDHLTDEQRRAYALAHNRTAELSEWDLEVMDEELSEIFDIDMDAFGFDEFGPVESIDDVEEDDFRPDIQEETRSKAGDIWILGNHRLICGDSTDPEVIQRLMDGKQADLFLTDPPYNVALGQNSNHPLRPSEARQLHRRTDGLIIKNDSWEDDDAFVAFLEKTYNSALPAIKDGGAFYIWHASNQAQNFIRACEETGMQIRQTLIWVKSNFALGRQDYQWRHEPCLYGWKDGAAHYFTPDRRQSTVVEDQLDFTKMKKAELVEILQEIFSEEFPTTVMHEDKPMASELHPTMKPIKLMARCIQNSTKKGEIVLDTFGGSGSTLMACEQLGRACYTVELDEKYCDVIIDRWEKFTGKTAVLACDDE